VLPPIPPRRVMEIPLDNRRQPEMSLSKVREAISNIRMWLDNERDPRYASVTMHLDGSLEELDKLLDN
jgi:hypothetical protein